MGFGGRVPNRLASKELPQGLFRAAKRQLAPRDLVWVEEPGLQPFVVALQCATQDGSLVDDDDGGPARVRVDVDQLLEPDFEAGFLPRLADGGGMDLLAAIHVAARKHPFAVAWLDGPAHQHDPALLVADDGAHGHFRVQIEDESTSHADQPLRFGRLQRPRFETAATHRAITVRALVVRVHAAAYNLPSC